MDPFETPMYPPATGEPMPPGPAGYGAFAPGVPPKKRRGRGLALGAGATALAVVAGMAGAAGAAAFDHHTITGTAATPVRTVAQTGSIADIVAAVDDEVVSITVTGVRESDEGSGVVVRADGMILTNNHVIAAAAQGGAITVTFTDGSSAKATIVATDTAADLAIIHAAGVSGRAVATLGDSDSVQVGDTVIAIGNELGLPNSVSAGIVSAVHRKVTVGGSGTTRPTTYNDTIQTDAAINEGDSGGALFDLAGNVVGIDSAIATASNSGSGSVGIGFAIASNDATSFVKASLGT